MIISSSITISNFDRLQNVEKKKNESNDEAVFYLN